MRVFWTQATCLPRVRICILRLCKAKADWVVKDDLVKALLKDPVISKETARVKAAKGTEEWKTAANMIGFFNLRITEYRKKIIPSSWKAFAGEINRLIERKKIGSKPWAYKLRPSAKRLRIADKVPVHSHTGATIIGEGNEKFAMVEAELAKESELPEPSLTEPSGLKEATVRIRSAQFAKAVKSDYAYSCAVCGKSRRTRDGNPEVEAAHIYPISKNGSNDFRNGLSLCKIHHWAFENGLFSVTDDYKIVVEKRIKSKRDYREISSFENKELYRAKEYWPHPKFLKEHRKIHGLNNHYSRTLERFSSVLFFAQREGAIGQGQTMRANSRLALAIPPFLSQHFID